MFSRIAKESAQNDHATMVQSILKNKELHIAKIQARGLQLGCLHTALTCSSEEELQKPNSDYVELSGNPLKSLQVPCLSMNGGWEPVCGVKCFERLEGLLGDSSSPGGDG